MINHVYSKIKKRLGSKIRAWCYRRGKTIINIGSDGVAGLWLPSDLRKLLPPNPTCLDIGANEGQTIDMLCETLINPSIFSFEPSKDTFELLQKKYQKTNVKLFQLGIGSAQSKREFINYEGSNLSSFLEIDRVKENRFSRHKERMRETVDITTIDDFVERHKVGEIHLLKSDTQGFELEVLKGASGLFDAGLIHVVLIELNFIGMYKNQANAFELMRYLESKGLHLIDLYGKVRQGNTIAWCEGLFCRR